MTAMIQVVVVAIAALFSAWSVSPTAAAIVENESVLEQNQVKHDTYREILRSKDSGNLQHKDPRPPLQTVEEGENDAQHHYLESEKWKRSMIPSLLKDELYQVSTVEKLDLSGLMKEHVSFGDPVDQRATPSSQQHDINKKLEEEKLLNIIGGSRTKNEGKSSLPKNNEQRSLETTLTSTCPAGTMFRELREDFDAGIIRVPTGDDSVREYALPINFNFLGEYMLQKGDFFAILSNGQINVDGNSASGCCSAHAIGSAGYPRIAVAQADLYPVVVGDVFYESKEDEYLTVSYQGVPFIQNAQTPAINAQATLYPNGNVTICFSSNGTNVNNYEFSSGIEGFAGESEAFPTIGPTFDQNGITDVWPGPLCYCYEAPKQPAAPSATPAISSKLPSELPSTLPSTFPSPDPDDDCPTGTGFVPLAWDDPNVYRLFGRGPQYDDAIDYVPLKFNFNWLGWRTIPAGYAIPVNSNGQLQAGTDTVFPFYGRDAYPFKASFPYSRIALANADLNPGASGDVFYKSTEEELVVSFQNTAFWPSQGNVNVQSALYPDGHMSICFGPGDAVAPFATGFEDVDFPGYPEDGSYPADGPVYSSLGIGHTWPEPGYCFCFTPDDSCNGGCGNCHLTNTQPGCSCKICEDIVCARDSHCCDRRWDSSCAFQAGQYCECSAESSTPSELPSQSPSDSNEPSSFPSELPSELPSESLLPSTLPSTFPSVDPDGDCPEGTGFVPLSWDDPHVYRIFGRGPQYDDAIDYVPLKFDLNWLGWRTIPAGYEFPVNSNGQLQAGTDTFFTFYGRNAYPFKANFPYSRIALANADLNPGAYGDVFYKSTEEELVVSFQDTAFWPSQGNVNVQSTLYPDGHMSICFGPGFATAPIATGFEDVDFPGYPEDGSYPADAPGFSIYGISYTWPEPGYCFCFTPDGCGGGCGNCHLSNTQPGCSCMDCQDIVCARDSYCCDVRWDSSCAFQADQYCECSVESSTPSEQPSQIPSELPSESQPSSPAPSESNPGTCPADIHFVPLSYNDPFVYPLTLSDEEVTKIFLPFEFRWLGQYPINDFIQLSSNGQINIDPDDKSPKCCEPIPVNGSYASPRVAMAQEDLDPSYGGDVLVKSTESSLVISFQSVPFYDSDGRVTVQAELFPDGRVHICFGPGEYTFHPFATGMEDPERNVLHPANGPAFDNVGVSMMWPRENYCFCYTPQPVVCTFPYSCGYHSCGDCDVYNPYFETGCSCDACECAVCEIDSFCCEKQWDRLCALKAQEMCDCGGGMPTPAPYVSPTAEPTQNPQLFWQLVGGPFFGPMASTGFGSAVAVSANFMATGGPLGYLGEGLVMVYQNVEDVGWVDTAQISDLNVNARLFGASLALENVLGTPSMLVGAPRSEDPHPNPRAAFGRAYYYRYSDIGWRKYGPTIRPPLPPHLAWAEFGNAVAMASHVEQIAVGAHAASLNFTQINTGMVFTYLYNGSNWDPLTPTPLAGAPGSFFGSSLDMSKTGTRLLVGAPGLAGGEIFLYEWEWGQWHSVFSISGFAGESMGSSVSIVSEDGGTIAFGGPGYGLDRGVIRVFQESSTFPGFFIQLGSDIEGEPGEKIGTTLAGSKGCIAFGSDLGTFHVMEYVESIGWKHVGEPVLVGSPVVSISMSEDTVVVGLDNEKVEVYKVSSFVPPATLPPTHEPTPHDVCDITPLNFGPSPNHPPCSACGDGRHVTIPEGSVDVGFFSVTCCQHEVVGSSGYVQFCSAFQSSYDLSECGCTAPEDCFDTPGWYDSDGPQFNCEWYGLVNSSCAQFGDGLENFGLTANEACCVCGGGSNTTFSPSFVLSQSPSASPGDVLSISPWRIPEAGDGYGNMTAKVGDIISFEFVQGVHNVYIHGMGNCDVSGRTLVGFISPASYTFQQTDVGEVTFACDIPGHCDAGMILHVTVTV